MATEPMTDARLAEIRRGLECGCYAQKWVGELMAEIDRLRAVAKRDRLRPCYASRREKEVERD